MNRAKRKPRFWFVYGASVALFVILIIIGASVLTSWLDAFEQSQPVHAAEQVYQDYFVGEKWTELLKMAHYEMGPLESKGEAEEALRALKKDKVMSYYSVGGDDTLATYNVILVDPADLKDTGKVDDKIKDATAEMAVQGVPSTKIATITLKKSEKAGKYGFYGYEFSEVELFLEKKGSVEVCIPSHYSLYAGEKAIEADMIVETTPHEWNQYLPDDVPGVDYATYRFENLLKTPAFTVQDEKGNQVPLVQNEKSGVLEAALVLESQVDSALAERLMTGLQTYAAYMQDDGSIGAVSKYFDTNSDFYKSTRANPSSFVWDHNGYEFKNEVIEDFYFFNENTLCCHISFDQVLKMTGRENYVDNLSMTVYAHKVNGTWRIFNCVNS